MTSGPETLWEKSDRLLFGGFLAVRGATIAHDDGVRSTVAATVRVPAGFFQIDELDGSATVSVLLAPGEALGIGAWLRDAAIAADQAAPPLYDWE